MTAIIHQLKYGTNEVGTPRMTNLGQWTRVDTYRSDDPVFLAEWGKDGCRERRFVAGSNDTSPPHVVYPEGYDSRCSCCYLGFSHTDDCHAERIARYESAQQGGAQ